MVTEADWEDRTVEDLRPCWDVVLSAFGPRRLMYGSDWPVVTLAAMYWIWADTFRNFIAELSLDEQEDVCCRTGQAAYICFDCGGAFWTHWKCGQL
jgi:L-fuconolactonase